MGGNKYLQSDQSTLLKNKLANLSKKLQLSIRSGVLQTKEQYLLEAARIVTQFYKDLTEPTLEEVDVRPDDLPDPDLYNNLWQTLIDDLSIIFTEMENIESLTLANFNFITTETNRLVSRLKTVSSKLGDYILYSSNPTKDALFFKDSFNDLSKIDVNSSLLNKEQCNIDQAQGIITLPIDTNNTTSITIKTVPTINPNSNGVIGNNQEIGKAYNGNLNVLLDNNPDTWFEYERVTSRNVDNKDPLILDMVINLDSEEIVNFIRVNPNNFGTKTVIKINTIETSLDGQTYTSIKEDIPTANFTGEIEEETFTLAPSTSKFAGQGLYSFSPRKIKYVHLIFQQDEPYVISTNIGDRLRYAIGIRDIDIKSITYLSDGEIISKPFETIDEIRKVLVNTNQFPLQVSELGKIQFFLSPDDGATWHEIRPQEVGNISGQVGVPNILEFNSISNSSITTAVPVKSLRVKTKLSRTDENFVEGSSSFNKKIETIAETHQIPTNSPFELELEKAPVNGSVILVDPIYGSRGLEDFPYFIGFTGENISQQKYTLPFKTLPRPLEKTLVSGIYHTTETIASDWIHVEVGGEEWNQIDDDTYTSGNIYNLDINTGYLTFGNLIGGDTPAVNAPITMWMEPERLYPTADNNDHKAKLAFTASNNKNNMTIQRYAPIETITNEIISRNSTVIKLKNKNIVSYTGITSVFGGGNQETYRNGRDELVTDASWSIDTEHGIVYLKTPTSRTTEITVSYTYQPIFTLSTEEWDWGTTSLLRDSISIKEDAWKTNLVEDESLSAAIITNATSFDLSHLSIVEDSVTFKVEVSGVVLDVSDTGTPHPLIKEVIYQDGDTEFGAEDAGLYSIDYQKGRFFTQRPLDATITDIKVDYEYVDYRAKYYIARLIDPKHYEVDIVNQTIVLSDNEIMRRALIPHKRLDGQPPYYLVNYDYIKETREDVEALQPFYSPIVKDYALKVLTKGRIF